MASNQEIHDLADSGKLVYIKSFLPPEEAQKLFEELRDTAAWEQKKTG
jgi:hypothetical protein